MKSNTELIIEKFHAVRNLGFVKSNRSHNTGIGKTFEDYVGVVENNDAKPDLHGFEIKSHRTESTSFVTLFTLAPTFPAGANGYLNRRFGTPYESNPALNRLHTSIFAHRGNSYRDRLSFRLINDRENRVVKIEIRDIATSELLDDSVGYSYESIEAKLSDKLLNLFYVGAEREYRDGAEYFYFNRAEIYMSPSLNRFLTMLDDGRVMYDIRIGSYKSGRNYGKPHDHGSGFRMRENDIKLLYSESLAVE